MSDDDERIYLDHNATSPLRPEGTQPASGLGVGKVRCRSVSLTALLRHVELVEILMLGLDPAHRLRR